MSQPISPGEIQQTYAVGTQQDSPGEPQTATSSQLPPQPEPVAAQQVSQPVEQKPVETPPPSTPLQSAAQEAHDNALNGSVNQEQLNQAVAQAVKDQFAVTDGWKPKRDVQFVINLPSGQPALVRHLDTRHLLRANLLEEMDRFTKQLFPSNLDAQGHPVEKTEEDTEDGIWSVLRDPEKRKKFFDMTNRLLAAAAVRPKIVNDGVALRENEDTHEMEEVFGCEVDSIDEQVELFGKPVPALREGEAYAGAVDFADRMRFFQELNKPLEMIEPFRDQSDAVLASMESVQGSPVQAERPV